MDDQNKQRLVAEILSKDKWSEFLKRFIDVLKINIFIVDFEGRLLIAPVEHETKGPFGSSFLLNSFKFDLSGQTSNLIDGFSVSGSYLEVKDKLDLHCFAIPVKVGESLVVAYLVLGPVILNRRLEAADYKSLLEEMNLGEEEAIDTLNEIRTLSFVNMKSILDLLSEVVRDIITLNLEKNNFYKSFAASGNLSKEIEQAAQELYANIHLNELLVTILDAALNLTQAEFGSIMFLDNKKNELTIKVSKGLDDRVVRKVKLKIGEGIAGLAAKNNESFIIEGKRADNRLRNLLLREDLAQSAVIPLSSQDRVFGVLNLATRSTKGKIVENQGNLEHFSRLISTAIHSI